VPVAPDLVADSSACRRAADVAAAAAAAVADRSCSNPLARARHALARHALARRALARHALARRALECARSSGLVLFEGALSRPQGTIVRREPLSRADRGQRAPAHRGRPPSGDRVGCRLPRGQPGELEGILTGSQVTVPGPTLANGHSTPRRSCAQLLPSGAGAPKTAHLGCFTCELQELCETGGRRTGQPRGCVTRQVDHVTSDTTGHNSCYPGNVPPKQAISAGWPGNCRSYARGRVATSGAPTGRWAGSTLSNCA